MPTDFLSQFKHGRKAVDHESPPHTKIVATIGPASEDCVGELIDLGMTVARMNFSHGTLDDHRRRIEKVRRASRERRIPVGILGDLPGPKMRTGLFSGSWVDFEEGQTIRVRPGSGVAAPGESMVELDGLLEAVEPGHRIVLADGQVEVLAQEVEPDAIVGLVRRGGRVGDRKGVHLPDSPVLYELPTADDRAFIDFAIGEGVDMLGLSFVGSASDIETIRRLAPGMVIVSKIERLQALNNLDEILAASDGVMVARGDLGVELDLEELPIAQKALIQASLKAGKFTITATEMLESMINSSRPTRAEVSDVANAILDGTDAVMLSAETAVGRYPIETVAVAASVAHAVEQSHRYRQLARSEFRKSEPDFSNAVAMAAVHITEALKLKHIVCFTETGNTVRLISRYRPHAEILALSPNRNTVRRMTTLTAVRPILFGREPGLEDMMHMAAEMLESRGLLKAGEEIVFVAGVPPGIARTTNLIKLHRIGEDVKFS